MEPAQHLQESPPDAPGTLGDVLYPPGKAKAVTPETDWVRLVRSVSAGDQAALHGLYERSHRAVYTLIVRITRNRETAEEVTLDVFHDVWRRAAGYDPADGTVLGWIMNQARSRAIDRIRFEQRSKRTNAGNGDPLARDPARAGHEVVEFKQQAQALRGALSVLSADERRAIEAAFFGELTHAEAALQLGEPLGTVKTRIRSGLHKLRQAMAAGVKAP